MSRVIDVDLAGLAAFPLPALTEHEDKDSRGRVLAVAGGARCPGAGILTGVAALRAGAGKLQLAATAALALPLGLAVPEAAVLAVPATEEGEIAAAAGRDLRTAAARVDAVAIGPGMMDETAAAELARAVLSAAPGAGFVIDAAALTGLGPTASAARGHGGKLVVTPHAGEMAKLLDRDKQAVIDDPIGAARELAGALQAVVVMKGADSFIVSPDGRAWRHHGGVVGLATSGSGDVLAGLIAGFLARGASPVTAAVWAVCVHAGAGAQLSRTLGPLGFLARELLDVAPAVMASVDFGPT
ncbi:MAG: NAD(P)H-hydrate dehydratase [Phenylobacterium sp.]|nr:NAD(P)H-hydrate dehydratase [Phenylobacterium sp.]